MTYFSFHTVIFPVNHLIRLLQQFFLGIDRDNRLRLFFGWFWEPKEVSFREIQWTSAKVSLFFSEPKLQIWLTNSSLIILLLHLQLHVIHSNNILQIRFKQQPRIKNPPWMSCCNNKPHLGKHSNHNNHNNKINKIIRGTLILSFKNMKKKKNQDQGYIW